MQTFIIEPHFDDAAYSVGGMLLTGRIDPLNALLISVFTRSEFAPYSTAKGIDEISALRLNETKSYCNTMGLLQVSLPYDEAPLRGYPLEQIFEVDYRNEDETALKSALSAQLQRLKNQYHPAEVFSPLGVSGHVDHKIVRECCEIVFGDELHYYEDLPYSGEIPKQEYTNWISSLTKNLAPVQLNSISVLAQRIDLLRLYKSQVAGKDVNSVCKYVESHKGERYWIKK